MHKQFIELVEAIKEAIEMIQTKVRLTRKQADGYFIIPLGKVNLVNVVTDVGMVG